MPVELPVYSFSGHTHDLACERIRKTPNLMAYVAPADYGTTKCNLIHYNNQQQTVAVEFNVP